MDWGKREKRGKKGKQSVRERYSVKFEKKREDKNQEDEKIRMESYQLDVTP